MHLYRFGAVLENVVFDPITRIVDYSDGSITENTRCAYPIEHIPNAQIPCIAEHPRNLVLLTCDAFGVLPPISKLTSAQAQYHFISGYTAKVAGTEEGIQEPTATFSACFGEPFIVWHPTVYSRMLAQRMHQHAADAWLINTGWTGGKYEHEGTGGHRISLKYSRAIMDAIHSGELSRLAEWETFPVFGLQIPVRVSGIPDAVLHPERAWKDSSAFREELKKLASLFQENFAKYAKEAGPEVCQAGPAMD
jgi:phosphoenolpyruvate carboxykinase (ATP)